MNSFLKRLWLTIRRLLESGLLLLVVSIMLPVLVVLWLVGELIFSLSTTRILSKMLKPIADSPSTRRGRGSRQAHSND